VIVLWRDAWLKPLSDFDVGTDTCKFCKKEFANLDFVTSCDFCEFGVMHDLCANSHIMSRHSKELNAKVKAHRDKPLHDFQ
jgi:hypothetical protein